MHPNWIGLSSSNISWKTFVSEKDAVQKNDMDRKRYVIHNNDGMSIKEFYLDVISSITDHSECNSKPIIPNLIEEKLSKHEEESKLKEPSEKVIFKFLSAAQNNNVNSVSEILSSCPMALNCRDNYGWTALMCAVKAEAFESIKYLINSGADKYIKDKNGRSAYTLTKSEKIINLLKNHQIGQRNEEDVERVGESLNEKLFCESCKEEYEKSKERQHRTSTIHVFNSKQKFSTRYGISENNKGFQLLVRKGWDKEMGLGPSGSGNKFPIKTVLKNDRCGLGAKKNIAKITHFKPNDIEAISHRTENQRTRNKKRTMKESNREKYLERKLREELS